jgi:hypothetical protein
MNDTALAFVEQIMTNFRAAASAQRTALDHAIACGKAANLAKENVEAEQGKGNWTAWRETNLPGIPQTTLSLYMRLAENEDLIADAESIRAAIEKLPKRPRTKSDDAESDKPAEDEADNEGTVDEGSEDIDWGQTNVSTDLADLLPVVSADDVFPIIRQHWSEEELNKLAGYLDNYLALEAPPLALAS